MQDSQEENDYRHRFFYRIKGVVWVSVVLGHEGLDSLLVLQQGQERQRGIGLEPGREVAKVDDVHCYRVLLTLNSLNSRRGHGCWTRIVGGGR